MSSYRFGVCIVESEQNYDPRDAVFDSYSPGPISVEWTADRQLTIRIPPGRVLYYESIWPYPSRIDGGEKIRIILETDNSLKPD